MKRTTLIWILLATILTFCSCASNQAPGTSSADEASATSQTEQAGSQTEEETPIPIVFDAVSDDAATDQAESSADQEDMDKIIDETVSVAVNAKELSDTNEYTIIVKNESPYHLEGFHLTAEFETESSGTQTKTFSNDGILYANGDAAFQFTASWRAINYIIHWDYETAYDDVAPDAVTLTKESLAAYTDILGINTTNDTLEVSDEFIDGIDHVYLMGRVGNVSHGYTSQGDVIDIMDWYSNESGLTHDDFLDFVEQLNIYFASDAVLESYENVSDETYVWIDQDTLCYVLASYDHGGINVSWRYEPERVTGAASATPKPSASPIPSAAPKKLCIVDGCTNVATHTITGLNGTEEYYCDKHYEEMGDILNKITGGSGTAGSSASTSQGEKNALKRAKEYLSLFAFSHDGLIDQLVYDGFSKTEAAYAVDNCGANWKTQAAKKAKEYLDIFSFSRSELIDQLEYDQFTHSEAVYGAEQNGY